MVTIMADYRRNGDTRPIKHPPGIPLTRQISREYPLRWLPRHGEPFCVIEWFIQAIARILVYLPVYISIVVTIMLILIWRLP